MSRTLLMLRTPRIAAVVAATIYLAVHVATAYTESINWDEFAFFHRGERTLATGELKSGGRPGFATLLVLPFVKGCVDAIDTIHAARLLWCAFTAGILGGLYVFIWRATRRFGAGHRPAILGVAALALVPAFLRWSIQVRTDHLGALLAIWGGVALLASARRSSLAILAGVLFGAGYHCTQKAVYVVLLVGVVAASEALAEPRIAWKALLRRALWIVIGVAVVFATNRFVVAALFPGGGGVSLEGGLNVFAFYRRIIGFRVYAAMVPSLWPQIALGLLVVFATIVAIRRREVSRASLATAWAVALAGLAVGWFHAAAFPYFWIVLGLFPAVALALAWPAVEAALRSRRVATVVYGGSLLWMSILGVPYKAELLRDTQEVQRVSMRFIEQSLPASARGFQADGALFCRKDPEPFAVYLREHVETLFQGAKAEQNTAKLLHEFRTRPLAFFIATHRLATFPSEIRLFWSEHYVLHTGRVFVPGRRFGSTEGTPPPFEALAPAKYVWLAEGPGAAELEIAGRTVAAGERFDLPAGVHPLRLPQPIEWGLLTLALDQPPRPMSEQFLSMDQLAEITANTMR